MSEQELVPKRRGPPPPPKDDELGQWTFLFDGDTRDGFVSVIARGEQAARAAARKALIEDADDMSEGDPEEDRQAARDEASGKELLLVTAIPMPKEGEVLWFDYGYSD